MDSTGLNRVSQYRGFGEGKLTRFFLDPKNLEWIYQIDFILIIDSGMAESK